MSIFIKHQQLFSEHALFQQYWGSHLLHSLMHKGEVVHGINLSIEPWWGLVGTFFTFMIAFLARSYAHGAIIQAYESADGKRLGFQLHNMAGFPGRKIEDRKSVV